MKDTVKYRFGSYTTKIIFSNRFNDLPQEKKRRCLFIFDEKTNRLFGEEIAGSLASRHAAKVVLPPGEEAKCWESVSTILDAAVRNGYGRDCQFVGVGGGIICDLSAFAASVYMRGCGLILVPTTLLAMVDASLGGKTGFNFAGYKNMVGTFFPAETILQVPSVLSTLPEKEMLSGIAENIKHACLGDESLFRILEERKNEILEKEPALLSEMIGKSVAVKAAVVEQDLTETGIRAHLNLGHTFAHALESVRNLTGSSHGAAVAWGLAMAVKTGVELGITDEAYGTRILSLLRDYGFCLEWKLDPDTFINALQQDKKKRDGKVRFILQKNLGETFTREVEEPIIRRVLANQQLRWMKS